jgi:nucleoside-diphosphate-sugar epimerase
MTGTLLTLGHGYTADALARRLIPQGWRVIGTTRDPARADAMAARGIEPLILPAPLAPALAAATHILASAAPGPRGDPFLATEGAALAAARPAWVGYLSTTAVYGDHAGGWVDEDTPPDPATPRGQARLAAEQAWLATGLPVHIFRLAGIYGPGRGPFEKLRDGTARRILKPGQVFSRIHVDDIAAVLAASMAAPAPGTVYNVCDDEPAPPEDVLAYAAALLGLPPPPAIPWEEAQGALSPMARGFYAESKRVRNDRIRRDLGVRLRWPTYREGLAAVLAAETDA